MFEDVRKIDEAKTEDYCGPTDKFDPFLICPCNSPAGGKVAAESSRKHGFMYPFSFLSTPYQ